MVKLVLLHKADSIYEDEPDAVYDFPRSYLKAINEAVGDWVVYYEPIKAGPRGYFATAKISSVIPKPGVEGRYLALIEAGSFLPFDANVPRLLNGRPMESMLTNSDGTPKVGGAVQLAVRRLPDAEFASLLEMGLPEELPQIERQRYTSKQYEIAEDAAFFDRPVTERLTRRAFRDVAFRRNVRRAYDYRCALSGLRLRNGGGRPEVQAAHIRPVAHQGSDSVRNGLALSGTLHWMFDRGLISVAEDCETVLVSHNKVPSEVVNRLLSPAGKLYLPDDPADHPHPNNLKWHRENVFGQIVTDEPAPWA